MAELLVAEPSDDVDAVWFVPNDPVAAMHTHLALARFTAGDTDGRRGPAPPHGRGHRGLPFPQGAWSQAYASGSPAGCRWSRAASPRRSTPADALVGLATRHGFDNWSMVAMTNQAAVQADRAAAGRATRRSAVDARRLVGRADRALAGGRAA